MTRTGKIARLPRPIRDQLNCRLDDGESGARLVAWLNALDKVQEVLRQDFEGRPINEQNLSEWRQGGFLEWQQHQQSCDWARSITDEAERVADESGAMPLTDRLSSLAALALGKIVRDLAAGAGSDPDKRAEFLGVLKDLGRMRRDDLQSASLRTRFEYNHSERLKDRRHTLTASDRS